MIKQKAITLGLLLLLLLTGLMFAASVLLLSPTKSSINNLEQTFIVKKNESVRQIATRLYQQKLIRHPLIFRFVVWRKDLDKKVQAGSFKLSSEMTAQQIAERLTQGVDDLWVTIPEGLRVEEVAELFANQTELTEFDPKDFISQARSLEGYLFPDTYLVPKTISTPDIITLMRDTFDNKVIKGLAEELSGSSRPLSEIVVMASIIQREAGGDKQEMAHISGILWNRIKAGEILAVDCTLQYIAGYDPVLKTWWAPPSIMNKQSTSQYNTYRYATLPPAPIASPGIDAIRASIKPLDTADFFYLHDSAGQIHFAETLSGHNANVQKYLK